MYNIIERQMLSTPLITYKDLPSYLKTNYNLKGSINKFIEKSGNIVEYNIPTKINNLPEKLYQDTTLNPGSPNVFDIALSLKKKSFITGYIVFSFLGWTEYIPKVIHINWKRNPFNKINTPIDNITLQKIAYKPKSISKLRLIYNEYEIIVLNGQVFKNNYSNHFRLLNEITELPPYSETYIEERLIIESLINYQYFGGADIVWQAGLNQFNKLDLDLIFKIYKELDLIYPYANAIGYWMEKSNISKNIISKWEKLVNKHLQFHLFMGDSERRFFNKKWNLYIPKRFM